MATTKKSTKVKTKTSKSVVKPTATNASNKTSNLKSVKNTTADKVVTTQSVKSTIVKKTSRTNGKAVSPATLINMFSGLVFTALAAAAVFLMKKTSYQVFSGHLTRDELASGATTVLVSAVHSLFDIELRWAVVGILALSVVLPLITMSRRANASNIDQGRRLHFWRWLEMGIVTGLMVEVIALLSGVQDLWTLKVIGGAIVISALLAWSAEKQSVETGTMVKSTSILSVVMGLLPWLIIGGFAAATPVYGQVRTQWFVYALFGVMFVGFLAWVWNLRNSVRQLLPEIKVARNFLYINLFIRVAFAAILIYGLRK